MPEPQQRSRAEARERALQAVRFAAASVGVLLIEAMAVVGWLVTWDWRWAALAVAAIILNEILRRVSLHYWPEYDVKKLRAAARKRKP